MTARLTGCKNIAVAIQTGAQRIAVGGWNCALALAVQYLGPCKRVGYRSHPFRFQEDAAREDIFPWWLIETSEALDKAIVIRAIQLEAKTGGKSGDFRR